ncbi:hypothetical protein L207DRAFT_1292, partial [Hyaloscypha variabilis F]
STGAWGDHSISLPILRALHKVHGPVSAIHIDPHVDNWNPKVFAGTNGVGSQQAQSSDGTPYYWAGIEGLLTNTSVHAGIRSSLDSAAGLATDASSGFKIIPTWNILEKDGVKGVIETIRSVVDFARGGLCEFGCGFVGSGLFARHCGAECWGLDT